MTVKKRSEKKTSKKPVDREKSRSWKRKITVVGIGASAGGLDALEKFFKNIPEETNLAFVIILHLDPHHIGIMPQLLQRMTSMKVSQVTDRMRIEPNSVYVIPPNKSMQILKGFLHLFDTVESKGLRLPVDIFFRSLADDMDSQSVGIILSGMGSDGCLGVKSIKEKNGLVLVQNPDTAGFDGMPKSTIQAILPDVVADVEVLPAKLISLLNKGSSAARAEDTNFSSRSDLEKIIILLREFSGHDYSQYKKNTLFRRIERRKDIHQIDEIQKYVKFLQNNPQEIEILFRELLIGVTRFFRDKEVWKDLRERILPELIGKMPDGYTLRAWVPGCSTGEEAYSLAIVFKEVLGETKKKRNLNLQIFATDIDADAIRKARFASFSKNIGADVSTDRLNRFFSIEKDEFRLKSDIREMVVFAVQNVIKDPPFTKLDIVSCRNMLIYMESVLQKKLITMFNYILKPDGIMILGTSESIGLSNRGFIELAAKHKIFLRTEKDFGTELIDFPSSFYYTKKNTGVSIITTDKNTENIKTLVDQIVIQNFSPPSVLVNVKGDIIYITGRTGKYLEPVAGKANWNIHAMARDGLSQLLPGAFRDVIKKNEPVILKNVKITNERENIYIDVTLQCIDKPGQLKGMVMVVFREIPQVIETQAYSTGNKKNIPSGKLKALEMELKRSLEELQSTREEMQTSREELNSTNEELQSTNEELQSTNEELTTSKEEMQSLNEELQTMNMELQSKVNEFQRAEEDMKNLLNSTKIATLFLDKNLNIRRFTEKITELFKLRDVDIGRPFTEMVSELKYPDMEKDASNVIKSLYPINTAVETKRGMWFQVSIMPYRTQDDRIDGLVITFTDITTSKKLESELLSLKKKISDRKKPKESALNRGKNLKSLKGGSDDR